MSSKQGQTLVWRPTKKQEQALISSARFILYGGARGGGKTDAAIMWLLYNKDIGRARSLIIRRNAMDLADFIDRANFYYTPLGATKVGTPPVFVFPSGYTIRTGHLAFPDAYEHFMGHEYQKIVIEELTHIPTRDLFLKLMGSLRSTIKGLEPQFFGTTNPGGVGQEWVKEFWHIGEETYPEGVPFTEDGKEKVFIPAKVQDNPHLIQADPEYVEFLKNLPVDLREKWYNGNWDDVDTENQYYAILISRLKKEGRYTKVPVEKGLRTFASFDLGLKDQMVIWIAQLYGREVRIIDVFAARNRPLKYYADYLHKFEQDYGVWIEEIVVPHDAKVRSMTSDTLQTRVGKLEELGFNVTLAPNVSRDDGIEAVRELLGHCYIDKERCAEGVRALRNYQKEFDEKLNRYKDTPLHDWASDYADSFRYLALYLPTKINTGKSNIGKIQKSLFKHRARSA